MHGRARETKDQTQARKEASRQKVAKYTQLQNVVLANHKKQKYDPESRLLSEKLLEANPEVYTGWNYRKRCLLALLPQAEDDADKQTLLQADLTLIEKALRKNPKSYGAWHHRKWLVAQGAGKLKHELGLCAKLLDMDERNFHCWSYRRFVVQKLGVEVPDELEFTFHKIGQNFSNYSAWHYRTKLLPQLHAPYMTDGKKQEPHESAAAPGQTAGGFVVQPAMYTYRLDHRAQEQVGEKLIPAVDIDKEFQCVQQAFFTEPSDQSGWFYHRWLISCVRQGGDLAALVDLIGRELEVVEELLDMETDSKWAILTMARLYEAQYALQFKLGGLAKDTLSEIANLQEYYKRLIQLDPSRKGYYEWAKTRVEQQTSTI